MVQCISDLIEWKVEWSLELECSAGGHKSAQPFSTATVRCDDSHAKRSVAILQCCFDLQAPWDPGGLSQCRLQGMPQSRTGSNMVSTHPAHIMGPWWFDMESA